MRMIRVAILVILLVSCSVVPVLASSVPDELMEALPGEAEQILDGMGEETYDHGTFLQGIEQLWRTAKECVLTLVRDNVKGLVLLLGVVLLCGVMDDLHRAADTQGPDIVPAAGALVITIVSVGSLRSLMGMGIEALEQLDVFAKSLLPTLAAAVAAGGGAATASTRQVVTVLFVNALMTVIRRVLVPVVYFFIAISVADAMMPEQDLKRLQDGIGKFVTWGLATLLLLFTAFLSLSGAVGKAADATAVRLTKSAISTAVPVVGGIISDATDSILAGAGVIKGAIGVFGMLGVLAICLMPFLHLAVQYLLYKLTAILASAMGSKPLIELIDALGSAFGLVLGMVGACALLLLISVASSVSVVVT